MALDAAHHERRTNMTATPFVVAMTLAALLWRAPRPVPRTTVPIASTNRAALRPSRVPVRDAGRWLAAGTAAVIGFAALGPLGAAGGVGAIVLVARARRHRAAAALRRDAEAALPDLIELVVMMVHAGHSPAVAIVEARRFAPRATHDAIDAVALRLERGHQLADALVALVDHLGPAAHVVADAIAAADRYGLPLGPVLERLAADARAGRRRAAEADARTLPVRLSFPLVTCALPSFALLAVAPAALATISSLRGVAT
jgi:Flp pilus assembly protein TadB